MDFTLFSILAVFATLFDGSVGAYYGKLAGSFPVVDHDVSGTVYVVDQTRLFIKGFTYDGKGPDAFFWFGTSGSPSGSGTIIPNEKGSSSRLLKYVNEDLLLTLTSPAKVSDIKWLSVWCRQATADFSSFNFPTNLAIPAASELSGISGTGGHGTSSGTITVLNSRTIRINSFNYDGSAPDTFFILGKGSKVKWTEGSSVKLSDETGSYMPLKKGYQSKTIDILAPKGVNIADYDWFSVYCVRASENFGSILIPDGLNVPPADSEVIADSAYYGLDIGFISTLMHAVAGQVFVVDYRTLFIKEFNYDGGAPESYFYYGTSGTPSEAKSGQIPDENGNLAELRGYDKENIILTMPKTHNVTDIKWLSVWCESAHADMGNIIFPDNVIAPKPASVASISSKSHGVSGGPITLLDSRTILIEKFSYNGEAPDTFFVLGKGNTIGFTITSVKVPDENGKLQPLGAYSQKTIQIQAPPGVNVADYTWMSVYCVTATENFGDFNIPSQLSLPPSVLDLRTSGQSQLANCIELVKDELNVHWQKVGTDIIMELEGKLDGNNAYMAFGLSGSATANQMKGADVTVAYYDQIKPVAVDYYMYEYAQCSEGQDGACPDARSDVSVVSGSRTGGITKIRFQRKLNTGDSNSDKVIPSNSEIAVVWALGKLTPENLVLKHSKRTPDTLKINFGRSASRSCSALVGSDTGVKLPAWEELKISGADTREFNFKIGQSGGQRGYAGITGQQGWGIAFYINDLLIPELTLRAGDEYTFNIETGDNVDKTAEYHPVYITTDNVGGYVSMKPEEINAITVFAGLDNQGKPLNTAVGRLCEYVHKSIDQSDSKDNFNDFFGTMDLKCHTGQKGSFKWTPTKTGTYYYQCYQHRYLGWKIKVVDEFTSSAPLISSSIITSLLLSLFVLLK